MTTGDGRDGVLQDRLQRGPCSRSHREGSHVTLRWLRRRPGRATKTRESGGIGRRAGLRIR